METSGFVSILARVQAAILERWPEDLTLLPLGRDVAIDSLPFDSLEVLELMNELDVPNDAEPKTIGELVDLLSSRAAG
jgi:hypothetical protein